MVVFLTVSDPSKVSIKESIERLVFILQNFVVFKILRWFRKRCRGWSGNVIIG